MNKGEQIEAAQNILMKVYKEVMQMANEFETLLIEKCPDFVRSEDYSYSSASLQLKTHFMRSFHELKEAEEGRAHPLEQKFVGFVIVFTDTDNYVSRVKTEKNEPQVFFIAAIIKNRNNATRAYTFAEMLQKYYDFPDNSGFDSALNVDGNIIRYTYPTPKDKEDENGGIWKANIIGYKLAEIESAEFLRDNVIAKLGLT